MVNGSRGVADADRCAEWKTGERTSREAELDAESCQIMIDQIQFWEEQQDLMMIKIER